MHSLVTLTHSIILLFCVLIVNATRLAIPNKEEEEDVALESAIFVLDSLKDINDSLIYEESLHLHLIAVRNTSIVDGLYHMNKIMTVELSSPHFYSGNATEIFDIIVMESKPEQGREENGRIRRGYAIDRFPKMNYDEVDASLQRKNARAVERNKGIRKMVLSR